jgi:uroporphyrinogen decarboxylase
MTPRERVAAAMAHSEPDFTPCDYFATPEIRQALCDHFGVTSDDDICDCLGTDVRYVNPPYVGPPPERFDDGSWVDEWGVRRRMMPNEYGEYAEPIGRAYAAFQTVEDVDRFSWPSPDWYDYEALPALCATHGNLAIAAGGFYVQDFINRVAMGRGVEQVLMDIGEQNPVYLRLVEIRHRFYMRHIERTLDAARGRIDLVLCGDDFGSQRGPLISANTFHRLYAPLKKEFFDMVHSFGAKVTHHCCGSSRKLIPHFVACGMDALQTIQPQAAGMNPYELKREFAGQIVLHGAVDVQGWLQRATPAEVRVEIYHLIDEVGRGGGYILAPCHQIQPDTPLENVLALYEAVAERRGRSIHR